MQFLRSFIIGYLWMAIILNLIVVSINKEETTSQKIKRIYDCLVYFILNYIIYYRI